MSLKQMDTGEVKAKYEELGKILTVDDSHFVFRLSDDEIDRRTRLTDAEYAKQCHLEGVIRTQAQLLAEGKISG